MSDVYHVKDVNAAISLANEFKTSGTYNLFRGQAKNWPVMSSLGRLLPNNDPKIKGKIERLFMFFDSIPALHKYKLDVDWFWAVAQHYGFPTNYIDFTFNPGVAGYFATNNRANLKGEQCVIACVNELDFISFIDGLKKHFEIEKVISPYIARVNVDNLWRLQAQEGCFLFTPYNNIEFYYDFDRILFPYSEPYRGIHKEHIYPIRKSELEIYLDQFFNSEQRREGYQRFVSLTNTLNMPVTTIGELEYGHLLKNKEEHRSWRSADYDLWSFPLSEAWKKGNKKKHLHLSFDQELASDSQFKLLVTELKILFEKFSIDRMTYLRFHFDCKHVASKRALAIIVRSCSRIWDGTRNLPFTDIEIIEIIARYIVLEMKEQNEEENGSKSDKKFILLEMQSKYGSITRCLSSREILLPAFRSDLLDILSDQAPRELEPEILLYINNPRLIFDFDRLLQSFKNELIAYQVLYNSENENPVIFYTPAEIDVLGYA